MLKNLATCIENQQTLVNRNIREFGGASFPVPKVSHVGAQSRCKIICTQVRALYFMLSKSKAPLLDEYRRPNRDVRINIHWIMPHQDMSEQYVLPLRNLRLIITYLKRVGLIYVIRKIRSRLAEAQRNKKFACVGFGQVLEAPNSIDVSAGDLVLFYAPSINLDAARAVIDRDLTYRVDQALAATGAFIHPSLAKLAGWSPYAGIDLPAESIKQALSDVASQLNAESSVRPTSTGNASVSEFSTDWALKPKKPSAVIFGLGHYAKHIIVPNLPREFEIEAVHEIDAEQLASWSRPVRHRDTMPTPRDHERYDLWLVAGYHHMHAEIALSAMERGGAVAVEKPIATNRKQLALLEKALTLSNENRLFACFQRRYAEYNDWLREDLSIENGIPVNYNCISHRYYGANAGRTRADRN